MRGISVYLLLAAAPLQAGTASAGRQLFIQELNARLAGMEAALLPIPEASLQAQVLGDHLNEEMTSGSALPAQLAARQVLVEAVARPYLRTEITGALPSASDGSERETAERFSKMMERLEAIEAVRPQPVIAGLSALRQRLFGKAGEFRPEITVRARLREFFDGGKGPSWDGEEFPFPPITAAEKLADLAAAIALRFVDPLDVKAILSPAGLTEGTPGAFETAQKTLSAYRAGGARQDFSLLQDKLRRVLEPPVLGALERLDRPYFTDGEIEHLSRAIVDTLGDPYSVFLNREESEMFHSYTLTGRRDGPGILLDSKAGYDRARILFVVPGSPADQAGLKSGDEIVGVDGESGGRFWTRDRLRGPAGSAIRLSVRRGEETVRVVALRRAAFPKAAGIFFRILPGGVGYVYLENFDHGMDDDVAAALKKLKAQGMSSLVWDLRYNPGGGQAVSEDIARRFVSGGARMNGLAGQNGRVSFSSVWNDGDYAGLPVAVLINGYSASAAELLTTILQERMPRPARVFGDESSFGKGLVQTAVLLNDDTIVRLTTQRWTAPSGRSIHGEGVVPDEVVPVDAQTRERIKDHLLGGAYGIPAGPDVPDPVLDAAARYLRGK